MASQISDASLLKSFRIFYERLVKKAIKSFEQGEYEHALDLVGAAAYSAWFFHAGRFSDARIEEVALKTGEILESLVKEKVDLPEVFVSSAQADKKRVLHVATELYGVGGHTRLITNWIKKDVEREHWLVVTNQHHKEAEVPEWVTQTFEDNGGKVFCLSEEDSILKKSLTLRKISRLFDFVILHHHPDDVIPLAAFAVEKVPPVAILNHADHVFWLGVSVADLVLDLRSFGGKVSLERRKARHSMILPIPLEDIPAPPSPEEARRQLGIDAEKIILLSIGSDYKYAPTRKHDFFKTLKTILELNPQAEAYVIGPKFDENKYAYHERTHFLGVISDPVLYKTIADIFLESYPMSSYTALLEAARLGACPVLMHSPNRLLALEEDFSLKDSGERAVDEEDYINKVSELIRSPEKRSRISTLTKAGVFNYHCGQGWKDLLNNAYNFLEKTDHSPRLIENDDAMSEDEDVSLLQLKSKYFQMQNQPLYLHLYTNPQIYKSLNFADTLLILGQAVLAGEIKSVKNLRNWVGTIAEKWRVGKFSRSPH